MKPKILAAGIVLLVFAGLAFFVYYASAQSPLDQATFCNEGTKKPCPDIGICKERMKACENGKWAAECTGGTGPAEKEVCDNSLDDNCNGMVDECVSLTGSIGIFLIIGGAMLLVFALLLSRFIK
jgi:uncharacterized membrane protein YraQ (UPF0718 family)